MEESIFEKVYQERLEERIIAYKIATGSYGMQYLDYKVLAQLILQTIQSSATE